MAGAKELRSRIKSVKNMSKATKAMELVSAAKMRRAQDQALHGRPYSQLINSVLRNIVTKITPETHPLLLGKEEGKELVLLITSNRGLCGALNTNLFKKTFDLPEETSFVTVGKKGQLFVSKTGKDLVADFELPDKPSLESSRLISKHLIDSFLSGEVSKVHIIYSDFESTLKQSATIRILLPIINQEILNKVITEAEEAKIDEYLFEPGADKVLETILPHYIQMEVYQTLLEAAASEHSARMVTMKSASDNANELVDDLTLVYNQARQAAITNELLDITTASIALE